MTKKEKITAIKGTSDILPPITSLWQKVEEKARRVFEGFNYREIRTPIFERTELFARGIGEATDIVDKEMFSFKDKNEDSISLRPEGTASVVRSCIENNLFVAPLKFYYIGPMFRYEKPQKGRQRQFHQLGAEAIGIDDPMIDAELIYMCDMLLKGLGISGYTIEINCLGDEGVRAKFKDKLLSFLDTNEKHLCKNCLERKDRNPLRIFDCKEVSCKEITPKAPKILDFLTSDIRKNFEEVQTLLSKACVKYKVNPYIVRGLDYYTKTVFEFTSDKLGAQNSILGGGRYNNLIEELGGPPTPASGFAIGEERLVMLLQEAFDELPGDLEVYISTLGQKAREKGFLLAKELRAADISTEIEYADKNLKWQLGRADKLKAMFTIIIGDDEIAKNEYTIRNMLTKEQLSSKPDETPKLIKSLIKELY